MIEIRVYRDTDPATPKDERFLGKITAGSMSVVMLGPSEKSVREKSEAFIKTERERQAKPLPPRLRHPDLAPPPSPNKSVKGVKQPAKARAPKAPAVPAKPARRKTAKP